MFPDTFVTFICTFEKSSCCAIVTLPPTSVSKPISPTLTNCHHKVPILLILLILLLLQFSAAYSTISHPSRSSAWLPRECNPFGGTVGIKESGSRAPRPLEFLVAMRPNDRRRLTPSE